MQRPSCFLVVFPGTGLFHSVYLFMKLCTENIEKKTPGKKKHNFLNGSYIATDVNNICLSFGNSIRQNFLVLQNGMWDSEAECFGVERPRNWEAQSMRTKTPTFPKVQNSISVYD